VKLRRSDQSIDNAIGNLLRAGVTVSACVVLCGGIVYLARNGAATADYRAFQGETSDVRTVSGILHSASLGQGRGIVQLGLLLLIVTPVARVVLSIWAFAAQRDRLYVGVASLVLIILLCSVFWGRV
jgi:uncharacterized membrane protein